MVNYFDGKMALETEDNGRFSVELDTDTALRGLKRIAALKSQMEPSAQVDIDADGTRAP